jgi:hypothetical protein
MYSGVDERRGEDVEGLSIGRIKYWEVYDRGLGWWYDIITTTSRIYP